METCLAETGANVYYGLLMAALLIGGSFLGLHRTTRRGFFMGLMASGLLLQVASSPIASAATACPASAQPDTSTGLQGQVQSYSVLSNDQPSPGSSFVLSSLRLGIVSGQVLGTSISNDKKTITTPYEGVYVAQSDGIIRFTPEPDFVGQAKGVNYFIDDSAGVTSSSTYKPVVTGNAVACANPQSEGITLVSRRFSIGSGPATNGQTSTGSLDDIEPKYWDDVVTSSDGNKLIFIGNGNIYTSPDGGSTAQISTVPGNLYWYEMAASQDVQRAIGLAYDEDSETYKLFRTIDSGVTWSQQFEYSSGSIDTLTSSADGMVFAAHEYTNTGSILNISTDGGNTWTNRPTGFFESSYAISDDGSDVYVADYYSNALRISHDGGATWTTQNITVVANYSPKLEVSADGTTLLLIAETYVPITDTAMFISTNDGVSWTNRSGPWTDSYADAYDVSADLQTMTFAMTDTAVNNGYLYKTTNGGVTWTQQMPFDNSVNYDVIAMSADGIQLKALVYDYDNDTSRLESSGDGGATWGVENTDSEQAFSPQQVDIDTATPGQQRTLDRTTTEGWSSTYDPNSDVFTLTVTNATLFDQAGSHQLSYTFIPAVGCQGPIGPAGIVVNTIIDAS